MRLHQTMETYTKLHVLATAPIISYFHSLSSFCRVKEQLFMKPVKKRYLTVLKICCQYRMSLIL